jgi:ATP-dependent DNA helicase RecG
MGSVDVPGGVGHVVAKFFRNIGLADELGSGMRNLYKYSKPYPGMDPVLDDGDVFEAFVPVRWAEGSVEGILPAHGEQVNEQVNSTAREQSCR